MGRFFKRAVYTLILLPIPVILVCILGMNLILNGGISNPGNRKSVGEISTPSGFERVEVAPGSFGEFVRQYPLKKRGSRMVYYDGSNAYFQYFGYAVLDFELINDQEYCADAVMRVHSDYLYSKGCANEVSFNTFSGSKMRYKGSPSDRKAFEKYLCRVYDASNTSTLRHQLRKKKLADIRPGDVLVYEANGSHSVGHAVLVVDVAVNKRTGKRAIMIAQSSMPALSMHIVRNFRHPILSPWIIVDEAKGVEVQGFVMFLPGDLRAW